jgi:hypothetical protein
MNIPGLDAFDENFTTSLNQLESLPDGEYEFHIVKAELKLSPMAQKQLLIIRLRTVDEEGKVYEGDKVSSLASQQAVTFLANDLKRLGFDVDEWKLSKGRAFSKELPKAISHLPGIVFKGKKKMAQSKNGDEFLNIYVTKKVGERPVPQEVAAVGEDNNPFGF